MSELDGMDKKLEAATIGETKTSSSTKKIAAKRGKKLKGKRRMSMMSQLEAKMEDDDDNTQSNRRKGKNRRMSTNITAAQMAMANRQSGSSKHVDIFLLDGTDLSISVNEKTKVRHALLMIKDLIQLENDADFGLFELRGGFAVGVYHMMNDEAFLMDIMEDWIPKQSDSKFLSVGDPEKRLGNSIDGPKHIVLKRRLYLPWSPLHKEIKNATSIEDTAHKLEYIECLHHVMYSRYPVSKDRAVKLAALRLQMELGDWSVTKYPKVGSLKKYMLKFLPKYTLENRKVNKYEQRVVKDWKQLGGYTPLDAQQNVIDLCKFWFPWYGCEFFRIDYQRKKEDGETRGHMLTGITLAIGHGGLHFLYRTHGTQKKIQPRMLLASHKYAGIDKWITAKSGKVFSFYLDKNDLCFVVNAQCHYIELLVREYIFEFMEVTEMMKKKETGDSMSDFVSKSPSRTRSAESTNGNGDSNDQVMEAKQVSTLLSGDENAVRVPYDRFVSFYEQSNDTNITCDAFLKTNAGLRAPNSAVNCELITKHMSTLSESKRNECVTIANKISDSLNLPDGWEMVEDDESNKMYYVHTVSGASQWTRPTVDDSPAPASKDGNNENSWIEVEDPSTGKVYFFNEATGETSWHPNGDVSDGEEEEAVVTTHSRRSSMAFAYDGDRERSDTGTMETLNEEDDEEEDDEEAEEDEDMDLGGNEWAAMTDESTGKEYYVNNITGESQWDMPADAWTEHEHEGKVYWVNSITGKWKCVFCLMLLGFVFCFFVFFKCCAVLVWIIH